MNLDVVFDYDTGFPGYNLFAYCGNSPVFRIDVSGKDSDKTDEGDITDDDMRLLGGGGDGKPNPGGGSGNTTNLTTQLTNCANNAKAGVSGKGPVVGTKIHSNFSADVKNLNNPNLRTEVSYLNGVEVTYGTKGSIRFDVVLTDSKGFPISAWDLKTGNAMLTDSRIMQMQARSGLNIPIMMVK